MASDSHGSGHGEELHTEVGHDGGHGSTGLPQLATETYPSQLFWLLVSFFILYWMMSKVALPRIAGVLEERQDRIADDLEKASELKAQTDAAIESYETALAEARARALAIAAETRQRVTEEIEHLKAETEAGLAQKLDDAETRIRATKETALAKVRDVAADTMADVVEALLGESIDADTARRYVDAEMTARRTGSA